MAKMANEKGRVFETVISMSGEISPALAKTIGEVQKQLDGVNLKALAVGAAVGGIAIATAKAVVESVEYLAELGDAYNSAVNDMAAATGLYGDELDELAEVMEAVYANNFGDDMADVADGLAEVYRVTGLVDEALQDATESGFALRDTFGYEMAESARTASALMKNFGLEAADAYNLIALGAQNGADQNGDLLDTLNEYAAQYAALGLSADQFMASLISGNEAGVFSIDKVGDAVKEFNIRSKDLSTTSADAFASLGFEADEMFARFAAGGDSAESALFEVLDALENTDDATVKNAAAVGLFGTMYEDLEQGLIPILQTMEGVVLDDIDALERINAVKYDNLSDAFEGIKRQGEVMLLPLASTIAEAFTDIAPVIGDLFEEIGPLVEQTVDDIMPFVTDFLSGGIEALQMLMPYVRQLAATLLPILGQLVENLLPPVLDLVNALLPPLMDILNAVLPPILSIVMAVLPVLTEIARVILPTLAEGIVVIAEVLSPLLNLLSVIVGWVVDGLDWVVDLLLTPTAELWPFDTFAAGGFTDGVSIAGEDGMEAVISFDPRYRDENLEYWAQAGELLGIEIDLSAIEEIANMHAYAAGGFTDGVSIAGEEAMEAVISFDPAYRAQNLSYWAQAGRMLGADASDYDLGSYSETTSTIDLGGVSFAPNININGDASKDDIIAAIEEAYPEFVDLLERVLTERGVGVYG